MIGCDLSLIGMFRDSDRVKICQGQAEDHGDERQLGNLAKQREAQRSRESTAVCKIQELCE